MDAGDSARHPAVAGQFYESDPRALARQIEGCYLSALGPGVLPKVLDRPMPEPLGLVVPHAGYIYSGPIAAKGFYELASRGRPECLVLLGPNHYGVGADIALSSASVWQTPLGLAKADREMARVLQSQFPRLAISDGAHKQEHSIEVQVPFLQHLYGASVRVLPIVLADQSLKVCRDLGRAIAQMIRGKNVAVIASTDLSHYHAQSVANKKDRRAIEAMLSLRPEVLDSAVRDYGINMCGPGAVMAMLSAMGRLGARRARLLGYATSGDTGGNLEQVVGYCALIVEGA